MAKVIFRGVCLYVHNATSPLTVLYPTTSGSHAGCRAASEHFGIISLFDAKGELIPPTVPFSGIDLVIESESTSGDLPTEVVPDGIIDLRSLVKAGTKLNPTDGPQVAMRAKVSGGRAEAADESKHPFFVPGHRNDKPMHGLSWEPGDGTEITIVSTDRTINIRVAPTQTAIIGHYDYPNDAAQKDMPERRCEDDGKGALLDVDFAFLYKLLNRHSEQKILPEGPHPSDHRSFGGPPFFNPLTSTCFGATWLDE